MDNILISSTDRKHIESKYHKAGEEFDSFNRMKYRGYDFDPETGLQEAELNEGLKKIETEFADLPKPIIKAKMFEYVLDNTMIDINEHDYFVGIYSTGRLIDKYSIDKWFSNVHEKTKSEEAYKKGSKFEQSDAFYLCLDFDHSVPDWDSLSELGFAGILERAEKRYRDLKTKNEITEKQAIFYRAIVIEYSAILRLIERMYNYAEKCTFSKAKEISDCLKHLKSGKPQTTYDMLQLMYIYFMISECVEHYQVRSLGYGLDGTLYSFYKNDIKSGRFSKEQIAKFLAYFMIQFHSMGHYWGQPMYLGGCSSDGSSKVNELSYLILDTYDSLKIYNPKIQIKFAANTPKDFIVRALEMIRSGSNSIVFCNNDTITKALMKNGAVYEDAVDAIVKGCYEYAVKRKTIGISYNIFNAAKCLNYVFDNGFDRKSGIQVGLKTGDVSEFNEFEDFYKAYLKQLRNMINCVIEKLSLLEEDIAEINPAIMYSATIPKCIETMTDAMDGGIDNVSDMWLNGFATSVDGLMAVYELVYEKHITSLSELKNALECNWSGYEYLRNAAKKCRHKYGINDEIADYYASALHMFFSENLRGKRNPHGGIYEYELHSALNFLVQGEHTLATPDGRCDGDELSKNASPSVGADTKGVTALITSATKLDLSLADSGGCLDIMLHPTSVSGDDGMENFYTLLKTYMQKGGASVHFNIFDASTLRNAQKNPEKYQNLQVRVCGWNVLWNNLSKKEQDAYIIRAENI